MNDFQLIFYIIMFGCLGYFIFYIALNIFGARLKYKEKQYAIQNPVPAQPKTIEVDVVIKEGTYEHVKVQNLMEKVDILSLQAEEITRDIEKLDIDITKERNSPIKNNTYFKKMVDRSLKLQMTKNDIESKILKCNMQIEDIAKKEYKRQCSLT